MVNRARLFIVSLILSAGMVFGQGVFFSPALAMTAMADWEMSMITAGRYLFYNTGSLEREVPPRTMSLHLNGDLLEMQEVFVGVEMVPIGLHAHRGYFDMGHERWHWKVVDPYESLQMGADQLKAQLNAANLTGADGKPVTVDQVVVQYTYDPGSDEQEVHFDFKNYENKWVTIKRIDERTRVFESTIIEGRVYLKTTPVFIRSGYWIVYKY